MAQAWVSVRNQEGAHLTPAPCLAPQRGTRPWQEVGGPQVRVPAVTPSPPRPGNTPGAEGASGSQTPSLAGLFRPHLVHSHLIKQQYEFQFRGS